MAEKAPPILLSCVSSRTGVLRGPPRNELVLILDVGRLLLEEMEQLMPFHIYLTTQCPVLSTSPTFTSSLGRSSRPVFRISKGTTPGRRSLYRLLAARPAYFFHIAGSDSIFTNTPPTTDLA